MSSPRKHPHARTEIASGCAEAARYAGAARWERIVRYARFRARIFVAMLAFLAALAAARAADDPAGFILGRPGASAADRNADALYDVSDLVASRIANPEPSDFPVLLAYSAQWDSLASLSVSARASAMVTWLASRPEVFQAGNSDAGGVWFVLKTGTPGIFADNRVPAAVNPPAPGRPGLALPAASHSSTSFAVAPPRVPLAGTVSDPKEEVKYIGLPDSNVAYVVCAFGRTWASGISADTLATDLQNAGYSVTTHNLGTRATLDTMKAISNCGMLYMTGHGCDGRFEDAIAGSGSASTVTGPYFALWTPASVDTANLVTNKPEIDARRAVPIYAGYGLDASNNQICDWQWGITGEFIKQYWTFSTNSLFVADMCSTINASIYDAAFSKNCDTYLGWTIPSDDKTGSDIARYHIRRMLGNIDAATPWETSRVRPFPLEDVRREMNRKNQTVCDLGSTFDERRRTTSQTSFGGLAPSVRMMILDSLNTELHIFGFFGSDPGAAHRTVTIGGAAVSVKSWGTYEIVATLTPDVSGPVVVKSRDRKSNAKPLAKYESDITIDPIKDQAGHTYGEAHGHVIIRADRLPYRLRPDEEPKYTVEHILGLDPMNPENLLHMARLGGEASMSTLPASCDKESTFEFNYTGGWTDETCGVHTISGSGTLGGFPVPPVGPPPMTGSGILFQWIYEAGTATPAPYLFVATSVRAMGTETTTECGTIEDDFCGANMGGENPQLLGADYGFPAGEFTNDTGTKLTWTAFSPVPEVKINNQGL